MMSGTMMTVCVAMMTVFVAMMTVFIFLLDNPAFGINTLYTK